MQPIKNALTLKDLILHTLSKNKTSLDANAPDFELCI